ncbi:uncharacterized protein LOC26525975 [Drosophila erecta]|uniref:Uncharacterized protein n=1 Tax=Drosophila erecta TaxID=7220 RepID=A0A0Q5WGJ4_DROER|nr:uncharacterized protein LOC26525975 [Drosophila erecta]KQS70197.1 uncharacterized protein Dere_GG26151 [Drosophila erecta]
MMAWLKWITILQVFIIFSAIHLAEFQELSDVMKNKLYKFISNAGSMIKHGSLTMQGLEDAMTNSFKIKKGAAKLLLDKFNSLSSKPQKDSPPASSSSCAKGDLMCEIKGVFASGSTQPPV